MTSRCSSCKCEKKLELFSIHKNTGRRLKTCMTCRARHKCNQCDAKFAKKYNLQQHIKVVHDKIKDHKCDECDAKFATNTKCAEHKKNLHDRVFDYECKDCKRKFNKKFNYARHLKTCNGRLKISYGDHAIMTTLYDMRVGFIYNCSHELKSSPKGKYLIWDFQVSYEGKRIGFIEYEGRHHFEPASFNGSYNEEKALKRLKETKKRDRMKDEYCKKNNISLLRIPYTNFGSINQIVAKWVIDNSNWGFEPEKLEEFIDAA